MLNSKSWKLGIAVSLLGAAAGLVLAVPPGPGNPTPGWT